jgi:hypothetical protein
MSGDEGSSGDEPVDGERPAEDTALADAVDEAMTPELRRSIVEFSQRHIMDQDRIRPPRPRDEIDDILDKLRAQDPDDRPGS